ncbi:MAG: alpha/beta hydrolase [Glaciihabitans sp.]|nr:alpha/beta hydrolase [Glaciihabitans sp.]
MDIILIPGFWLDGASWDEVAAPLTAAGHTVHALTLPGLESTDADRSDIGLRDHIDAVVATIDSVSSPVVLVGHSGGGAIAYGASDARPDRVARVIYVDSWPLGDGGIINDELPVVNGEVPLPDWTVFDDDDLVDMTDELRQRFRSIAIPEPVRVTSDKQVLSDDARRLEIPSTVIAAEFSADDLRRWIESGEIAELGKLTNLEIVEVRTGHWPQLTKPKELAAAILAAVVR